MESTVLQPQSRVLQHVPRWGIIRTLRQQSVAEHSYYVALYATYIAKRLHLTDLDCQWVTQAALVHDFEEMVSGDIPTPFKDAMKMFKLPDGARVLSAPRSMALSIMSVEPRNKALCEEIIRVADLFEATMYLADEYYMGNSTVNTLLDHFCENLGEIAAQLDEDLKLELMKYVQDKERTRPCTEFGLT